MSNINIKINNIDFKNPVFTAAGPNVKNSEMMIKAIEGGAGGIVSKTISVIPAKDKRPTIRKTIGNGLINSETWSEMSFDAFLEECRIVKDKNVPLIISIGYSPNDVSVLGKLIEKEINPSAIEFSTHYTGKDISPLLDVAKSLRKSVNLPIWMKISPATPNIVELASKASQYVDSFVAINSYGPVLDFDVENPIPKLGSTYGQGWMSGKPILPIALRVVYEIASCQNKPVIGVGGVETGIDAIKFFMAGASAVGICTASIIRGQSIYGNVANEINSWLDQHGYNSIDNIKSLYIENVKNRATFSNPKIFTDNQACIQCSICKEKCYYDDCIICGLCIDFCPKNAIKIIEDKDSEDK